MSDYCRDDCKFWAGLLVGGLVGAGIVFLIGTKEGKKVQKFVKQKGEDVLEDIGDKIEDLEEKGIELIKQGEQIKDAVIEEIQDQGDKLNAVSSKKLVNVIEKVEDVQRQGLSATQNLKHKIFKNIPRR